MNFDEPANFSRKKKKKKGSEEERNGGSCIHVSADKVVTV